jgi:MoaA/NifB/PqqE/SkfB family radical SAM enzyme
MAISREKQFSIFEKLAWIDEMEFGIQHSALFNYAGGVPCTIRGLGLYVKIQGDVFDCPGESIPLGNIRTESLAHLWEKAKPITSAFDGGCYPRDQFWKNHNLASTSSLKGGE